MSRNDDNEVVEKSFWCITWIDGDIVNEIFVMLATFAGILLALLVAIGTWIAPKLAASTGALAVIPYVFLGITVILHLLGYGFVAFSEMDFFDAEEIFNTILTFLIVIGLSVIGAHFVFDFSFALHDSFAALVYDGTHFFNFICEYLWNIIKLIGVLLVCIADVAGSTLAAYLKYCPIWGKVLSLIPIVWIAISLFI